MYLMHFPSGHGATLRWFPPHRFSEQQLNSPEFAALRDLHTANNSMLQLYEIDGSETSSVQLANTRVYPLQQVSGTARHDSEISAPRRESVAAKNMITGLCAGNVRLHPELLELMQARTSLMRFPSMKC